MNENGSESEIVVEVEVEGGGGGLGERVGRKVKSLRGSSYLAFLCYKAAYIYIYMVRLMEIEREMIGGLGSQIRGRGR